MREKMAANVRNVTDVEVSDNIIDFLRLMGYQFQVRRTTRHTTRHAILYNFLVSSHTRVRVVYSLSSSERASSFKRSAR